MVKSLKSSSLDSKVLKLGMQHRGLKLYKNYTNNDPGLTLTYFTARTNLVATWGIFLQSFDGKNLQQMTKLTENLCL